MPWRRRKRTQAQNNQIPVLLDEAQALFEAAEADYRQVLRMAPNEDLHYILLLNRGAMRVQCAALDSAAQDFQAAIQLRPKQFNAYASQAQVWQLRNRRDEAARHLTQAIQRQPNLAALYRTRAYLYLDQPDQLSSAQRADVLADLDEALRLEPAGSLAVAEDQLRRGLLLHRGKHWDDALAAYDAALTVAPRHAEAHRLRLATLLELRRYDEVLHSSAIALAQGKPTAHLYELRGLARAGRQDFPGAIEDYTQALALAPASKSLHRYRGWGYLVTRAYQLALHDFEAALKLEPDSGDALSGRSFARVKLGDHQRGVADALASLRLGGRSQRLLYNAARTLAQASASIQQSVDPRDLAALRQARRYEEQACDLLAAAVEQVPASDRPAYWSHVVQKDTALLVLQQRSIFVQLTGRYQRLEK